MWLSDCCDFDRASYHWGSGIVICIISVVVVSSSTSSSTMVVSVFHGTVASA